AVTTTSWDVGDPPESPAPTSTEGSERSPGSVPEQAARSRLMQRQRWVRERNRMRAASYRSTSAEPARIQLHNLASLLLVTVASCARTFTTIDDMVDLLGVRRWPLDKSGAEPPS